MILIPVLVGLYLIFGAGYYKLAARIFRQQTPYELSGIVVLMVLALSVIWPVCILFVLLKEALK